jgi:ABC-type branched-subunit amino acid transport system permease subunit
MPADLFAQALNGLAYGVLLFLLSVGLTLIFGMLDVVNLAHGSFYMLGAYAGLSLIAGTGNFWLALSVQGRAHHERPWMLYLYLDAGGDDGHAASRAHRLEQHAVRNRAL